MSTLSAVKSVNTVKSVNSVNSVKKKRRRQGLGLRSHAGLRLMNSLHSGLRGCSCIASDFVVLVLSPPRRTVLSETVLVLDDCLNCVAADR